MRPAPQGYTDEHYPQGFTYDQSKYIARLRTQRHPNPNLCRFLRRRIGGDAINADRGQYQRERPKQCRKRRAHTISLVAFISDVRLQTEFQRKMRINISRSIFCAGRDIGQRPHKTQFVGAK